MVACAWRQFGDQRGGAQAQAADETLMYLLDTNICVYVIRQRPEAVYRRLSDAAGESVALSVITAFGKLARYGLRAGATATR